MENQSIQKRLMIAAPASGSGKTVMTLALLRAFKNSGNRICAAKAGPDYIDPSFHEMASGSKAINLDIWAMPLERIKALASGQGEQLLVEAMMGLFDGAADGSGSAADLATGLKLPVLLVVDCAKQSHSIAALVEGFISHRNDVQICAVLLNKVGSLRHEKLLRAALDHLDVVVVGAVPRNDRLVMPQRHLGLVQAQENDAIDVFIEEAAELVGQYCDLNAIQSLFSSVPLADVKTNLCRLLPLGQRIAIARDKAFSFSYTHMLEDWHKQGAELSFFSPLADEVPNSDADGVYLPGGYPELHCERLSNASRFQKGIGKMAAQGRRIYGECGGYMALGEAIVDRQGKSHAMLGLLPLVTSFEKRKLHLGYRQITAEKSLPFGRKIRGHEFHYTSAIKEEGEPLFTACDALGDGLGSFGLKHENVMGSYLHVIDVEPDGG